MAPHSDYVSRRHFLSPQSIYSEKIAKLHRSRAFVTHLSATRPAGSTVNVTSDVRRHVANFPTPGNGKTAERRGDFDAEIETHLVTTSVTDAATQRKHFVNGDGDDADSVFIDVHSNSIMKSLVWLPFFQT